MEVITFPENVSYLHERKEYIRLKYSTVNNGHSKCNICNYEIRRVDNVADHVLTHIKYPDVILEDKTAICTYPECGKKFASVYEKRRHLKLSHYGVTSSHPLVIVPPSRFPKQRKLKPKTEFYLPFISF